jgi:hypothetical protein
LSSEWGGEQRSTHLDGQQVVGEEGSDAFAESMSTLVPYTKMAKGTKWTVATYSKMFKGTRLTKLAPKTRGTIIKKANKPHNLIMNVVDGAELLQPHE